MAKYQLDKTDSKILRFLVKNARMPFLEIARECGISGAAIHQRIRKMENIGVITGSRLMVEPQVLGLNVCCFICVSLTDSNKFAEVIERIKRVPEVVECHFVTGRHSLLLKLHCTDHEHLMDVIINTIQNIPGVKSTETMISLNQAFERHIWLDTNDLDDMQDETLDEQDQDRQ